MKHSTSSLKQQRILCYAPYNVWDLHGQWEITILHALKLRGADFRYVMCDGVFTECDIFWKATNPRHASSCAICMNQTERFAQNTGIPFHWLGQYLNKSDFTSATTWAESLPVEAYTTAQYGNWQIGTWVKSSVHSHFRMSELDLADPEVKRVYEQYLYSGLIACIGIDRLLDDYRPDTLLLFNGRMSSTRVALSLAQQKGIRTIAHERGFLKESILLKENGDCLDLRPIKQVWADWGDVPLNKVELDQILLYLRDREQGKNLSWKRFSPTPQPLPLVRQQLKIPEQSTVWVLFTSSDDEIIAAEGLKGVFTTQHEWISRTISYVKSHPDIRLIVRIHPNTSGKMATGNNQQQLDALATLSTESADNISFIMPEDDISSYSLMEIANIGLVYQSTVGLEMACKGKVVIVSAGSTISDLPFVITINSSDEYENVLNGYLNVSFDYSSTMISRMAYRYAYGIFFRYNIPFPLVEMPDPHTGVLKYSSMVELLPNKDSSLDRVARIILDSEPVCRPPEEHEKNRSSNDEDTWFAKITHGDVPIDLSSDSALPTSALPLVSVIIPCYNYAHYLYEAVTSVTGQTFQNFEIIIVNDGSTDNTIEVAEDLIASLPGHIIRLISTTNSGNPAFPRNTGVQESRGSYILFLDADDMIMPTFLEECVSVLDKMPTASIVYTDQIYFDANKNWAVPTHDYDFVKLLNANFMSYCSLFRKNVWDDVGGVPTDVGYEDWDFWIMSGLQRHYAQRIPKYLFCYRQHETGRFKNDLILRDQYLKAQIVLKHSEVYPAETVRLAEKTISASNNSDPFRVIAIISAHNEGDVIYHVIGDLIDQGVDVYLLNHCSTDTTVSEASKWLGKGLLHIENFPEDAGFPNENASEYIWRHILVRKEQLAAQLDGNWFIHADADEFRESPWIGMTLADAIRRVDTLGYNAIDFELLNFRPTDNDFVPGSDVRQSILYYDGYEKYDAMQVKAWKKLKIPVNIVGTAGHDINFAGRRLFPVKFLLRHYPVRSQEHGLKKVFEERKKRFNKQERADRWHLQYDNIATHAHNFIRDPKSLANYDPQAVRDQLFIFAPQFRINQSLECQPLADVTVSVSIIIPVFNQVNFTAHCLETLYATTPIALSFEVIIVNNASTDETSTFLLEAASHYSGLRVISNPENLMFSGGCNIGAKEAQGEYLLFLNNDTEPHPGWLEPLINLAASDASIGIIGSKLIFPDGTIQHAGIVVGERDGDPYPYHVHLGMLATNTCVNDIREYQMVTGACLLIRNELFKQVGGFDEGFINGHEDLDLCLKTRKAGFRVMYCPDSVVTHFESRTKQLVGMNNFLYQRGVENEEGRGRRRFLEIWRSYLAIDDQPTMDKCGNLSSCNMQKKVGFKILFTMYGWNESGGGTTFPKSVVMELVKRGYTVAVFYASLKNDPSVTSYSIEKTQGTGVTLYGIYNRPALFTDADNPEREINDPGIIKKFQLVLDEFSPDLIHFNNFHGLTFAIAEETHRRCIPSCFTPHNYHLIDPNLYLFNSDLSLWRGIDLLKNSEAVKNNPTKRDWFHERVATTKKLLNEWVDVTLAVSSRQRELLIQHGGNPDRIAVVHQANKSTDALWENELLGREANRELHAPLNIGFIGGVMPQKGVHMLVAAAQFFDPSEVEFHAYGFAIPEYLVELTRLDIKKIVKFHGEYSQAQLAEIAHGLDIAVVPSVWEDCAPLVVLELHAMRLPVIAARIGGIPDFITEGIDGLLYDPFDLKSLVDAIRICLDNPGMVSDMRRNLSAPTHTFNRYMDHLENVYATLLTKQQTNAAALSLLISRRKAVAISKKASILWHGGLFTQHSLAHVNRELCLQLLERGYSISFNPTEPDDFLSSVDPRFAALEAIRTVPIPTPDIHIRHQWPPDFTPPATGHWIMIQPWEYGSVPRIWIEKMTAVLDELWVPSSFVRDCYISSGLPAERVHVIPNGVDVANFNPDAPPLKLSTTKGFRFLFVGGTIYRKGIDLLLAAYRAAFSINDDVCLVIKDMGGGSFYKGQTAQEMIQRFQSDPMAPEIEYLDFSLTQDELPGLYTACQCLVHPYRGEGFGLPIAEAMACGLAPIVTGYGAALDFCPPESAWLIPATIVKQSVKQMGDLDTVDFPWLAEPDMDMLTTLMRYAATHPRETTDLGIYASKSILKNFTWKHAADRADERLRVLVSKPIQRFAEPACKTESQLVPVPVTLERVFLNSDVPLKQAGQTGRYDRLTEGSKESISLCMIVKDEESNLGHCLMSLKPVVHEIIVVDTGSTDRTIEIAKEHGARIFSFTWNGNFSDARNYALKQARGHWIFVMDADEVFSECDYVALRSTVAQSKGKLVAWSVTTRNYMTNSMQHDWMANSGEYPQEERGSGWCPSPKTRLFPRNKRIRFEGPVHEVVEHSLKRLKIPVCNAPFVVHHYGHLDIKGAESKKQTYYELAKRKLHSHPNDAGALAELATQAGELGHFDEALELWDRVIEIRHNDKQAHFNRCHVLNNLKRYQESIAAAQQALSIDPSLKEAAFYYATGELYVGDLIQAEAELVRILAIHHVYPPALALLTVIKLCQGDSEAAREYIKSLKTVNFALTDFIVDCIHKLTAVQHTEFARNLLQLSVHIGCMPKEALAKLGGIITPKIQTDIPDGETNLPLDDETTLRSVIVNRAISDAYRLAMCGEIDQAVDELLQKGIRVSKEDSAPYLALVDILLTNKLYLDALQVIPEMPETVPAATILALQAFCQEGLGEYDLAGQSAEATLALEPGNWRSLNVLGLIAHRNGALDIAVDYFERAMKEDPHAAEPVGHCGFLLWEAGDQQAGYELLQRSAALAVCDVDIFRRYRAAAVALGRTEEAAELFREKLLLCPENRYLVMSLAETLITMGKMGAALDVILVALSTLGAEEELLDAALKLRSQVGPQKLSAMGEQKAVSLCMIVKNEAAHLSRCLASVMPVVQEMVIVDTGSSDRTIDIATAFGAEVYNFSWTGSFSDARNFALSKAKGQWILVMDADEVFSALDHEKLRRTVSSSRNNEAWSIIIRNYTERVNAQGWIANDGLYPSEERADGWYPAQRVKLFPNDPQYCFSGEVHELVEPSLRSAGVAIHTAQFTVHHYGELLGLPEQFAIKQHRYFDLGKQKLAEHPNDVIALTELAVQAGELGLFDESLTLWDRVLVLQPDTVEALFNKSYALIGLRRYEEGLVASQRALELDPDHKEAAFNYGTCELYVGDASRALTRLEPLLEKHPEYPPLLAVLTVLNLAVGERNRALESQKILQILKYSITEYIDDRVNVLKTIGRDKYVKAVCNG